VTSILTNDLLIILLVRIVDNVEESELVDAFGGGDNTEPISQLLLLEELLCQILEVSSRELSVRSDLNLPIAEILDQHDITEVSDTVINLDLVLKELLEGGNVEDLVACGLRSVDDELVGDLGLLALRGFLQIDDLSLLYHAATS